MCNILEYRKHRYSKYIKKLIYVTEDHQASVFKVRGTSRGQHSHHIVQLPTLISKKIGDSGVVDIFNTQIIEVSLHDIRINRNRTVMEHRRFSKFIFFKL